MSSSATVRRPYKQTEIYDQMVDEHNVFNSYVDFFVFSACVGYAKDRCETQNYKGDSEMLWMHFSNKDLYRAVAAAIAYQHHNDSEALINPELQLKTLTMYAAGGADILEAEFGDIKGNPTNAVLNYIQDWDDQEDNESRQTLLAEIMADFEEGA